MNMLATVTAHEGAEAEKDVLGGGFGVWESGLYETDIALAYLLKSPHGALNLVLDLVNSDGKTSQQRLLLQSGDEKGNLSYYLDREGNKKSHSGFVLAQSLTLLTIGEDLNKVVDEDKIVNIYNYDLKKDVATTVPVLTALIGQKILTGLLKQIVNKKVKDGNKYTPIADTREENVVNKFFRATDRMTTSEILAQAESAVFVDTWETRYSGKTQDRSDKNIKAGAPGAAAPGKPTTSLFNKPAE